MKEEIPLSKKGFVGTDFLRSGSCIGDAGTNALETVRTGSLTRLADIINEDEESKGVYPLPDDHWINRRYPDEDDKSLLEIAIEKKLVDFVEVLVQAGANVNAKNPITSTFPIHLALQVGSFDILRLLFRHPKNSVDVNIAMKNGQTALHIAAENGDVESCDYLCRKPDINVDPKDKKGGRTPLYIAAKKGNKAMVEKLLAMGANSQLTCFNKTIESVITDAIPGFDVSSVPVEKAPLAARSVSVGSAQRLVQLIELTGLNRGSYEENLREFRSLLLQADVKELEQFKSNNLSLLQKATIEGLEEFVNSLLAEGVDPNGKPVESTVPPVVLAAEHGRVKILKLFAEYQGDFTRIDEGTDETVLHKLMRKGPKKQFAECLQFLLSSEELEPQLRRIINQRDRLRNTALHHATQTWPQNVVRVLLERGSNIGMKNRWDEVPVSSIQPETLEEFLDEFCLDSKGDVNHEDFELTFNYSFLAPLNEDLPDDVQKSKDPESQALASKERDEVRYALPETEPLWYMGQSKEHRHLLKHPVITSFLWLKWARIRRHFNRNLRFFVIFVFITSWYVFENYGGHSIRNDEGPIPAWFGFYIAIVVVIIGFIFKEWKEELNELIRSTKIRSEDDTTTNNSMLSTIGLVASNWVEVALITFLVIIGFIALDNTKVLWYAMIVLWGLLIVREFLQMTVSLKRYILSPENWIEVLVICLNGSLIFGPDEFELQRHFGAITMVLSWGLLITLIGKHPKLTRYNIYVTMFFKVMGTFIYFLCWYALFIVAFGMGFYIMLHKDIKGITPGDDDYIFFNKPWLSLVKTSTMFVGELEFSDIPVNLDGPYGPLSYVFFLTFVFLIVVVLMNLLNGLAVSDTGVIQEKAEIVSYISRVDSISYAESVLLGDPFNFLSNWPAFKLLKNIPSLSFCRALYRNRSVRSLFQKMVGATGILLFYSVLPSKKVTITPNRKTRDCRCCSPASQMDDDIIRSAKKIVLKKQEVDEQSAKMERLQSFQHEQFDKYENEQAIIMKKLTDLERKLDLLMSKL